MISHTFFWKYLKVAFFQKVQFVFQISKPPKWKYSKLLSWAWNLNLLSSVIGGKFKFQVQDSDLDFFLEIWKTHHTFWKKATSRWGQILFYLFIFACRCSNLVVGPDQRQVFYTVTGDNGQSQQYAMMDFRDPNLIHQFTNIRQIPEIRGNRTVRVPQQRNGPGAGGMHIIISTLL